MKQLLVITLWAFSTILIAQKRTTYIYSVKDSVALKLDIYTPDNIKKGEKLPTLLWMHGGGFSVGSRDYKDDAQLCEYASKNGYIGISISYRLLRKGVPTGFGCDCPKEDKLETFKQAAIDYLDAAAFVVKNAEKFHVNPNQIIAGGSSAGAEGTLNAVFMREFFINDLQKYQNVKFAGLFSCAGAIVDADYITKHNAIPSVFFHGTDDKLVPYTTAPHHHCKPEKSGYLILDGAKIIAEKLNQLEVSTYSYVVKDGEHEVSRIPFEKLNQVFDFFRATVLEDNIIQTKIIKQSTQ